MRFQPINMVQKPVSHRIVSKIKVKGEGFRFSGKILMRMSGPRNLLVFLTPMNQILFKLYIEEERSILINLKKGQSWKGSFVQLFGVMTGIQLNFYQLRNLILSGDIPQQYPELQEVKINITNASHLKSPEKIEIIGSDTLIRFVIIKRTDSQVVVNWSPRLDRFIQTDLETILTNE